MLVASCVSARHNLPLTHLYSSSPGLGLNELEESSSFDERVDTSIATNEEENVIFFFLMFISSFVFSVSFIFVKRLKSNKFVSNTLYNL